MNTIQNLFQQAQLAEAAYANFIDPQTGLPYSGTKGVVDALQDKANSMSFSTTQAAEFVKHWKIVDHLPDTVSGFSATLFESLDSPGCYSYAIRGTVQPLEDLLFADWRGIVENGLAMNQIVDMYNHWQRINAPAGSTYQAAKFITLQAETNALAQGLISLDSLRARLDIVIDSATRAIPLTPLILDTTYTVRTICYVDSSQLTDSSLQTGTGQLSPLTCSALDVAGHSLGGHLADAFTRLFPNLNSNAITINGAGFPTGNFLGLTNNADINIANLFSMLGGAATFDANAISNIHGDGLNMVSMNSQYGLVQQGANQEIYIETVTPTINSLSGNLLGHGAGQMTDSLAVYNFFAALSPNLNTSPIGLEIITRILKASSNDAAKTLESAINALGALLQAGNPVFNQNDFNDPNGGRDKLYGAMDKLNAALLCYDTTATGVRDLSVFDAGRIANEAFNAASPDSIAYRYALLNLTPLAVVGNKEHYFASNDALFLLKMCAA